MDWPTYYDWELDHAFLLIPAKRYMLKFLTTFEAFPPSQKSTGMNLESVIERLQDAPSGSR